MIDIHAHILPQVDDGPEDWEDALNLLKQGIEDGITDVVSTSHILSDLNDDLEGKLLYRFDQLNKLVKRDNLNINLYLAGEVHCLANFDDHSKVVTVNGQRKFLLLEFPMNEIPESAHNILFNLVLDGITPILAHPERNARIQRDVERVFSLVERGVLMQINAGSLLGYSGQAAKNLALDLIETNQAHFVASDAHNIRSRPMLLSPAYRLVQEEFGREKAETLFRLNPGKVVKGISLDIPYPEPIKKRRQSKFSFFRKR